MIWPTDALQLAATKLKTRRIRLGVTVFITAMMFGVLTFFAFFAEGVLQSLQSFSAEGYGNRYLVQASPLTYTNSGPSDTDFLNHFRPLQTDMIAQKKAAAKKLNIAYDEAQDQNLYYSTPTADASLVIPNFAQKLVQDYYQQKSESIPGTDFASFQKLATAAGAIRTYQGTTSGAMNSMPFGSTDGQPSVNILKNGTEDFTKYDITNNINYGEPKGMQTITTMGWSSIDADLMQPFVLPGQNLDTGADGSVPTIVPVSVAEEILGLKPLPATATSQEKLDRIAQVRAQIAGASTQLCYRNGKSASQVSQVLEQQKNMEAGKDKKDYVKPTLIYQLPATACGLVTVKSDTRTAEEKKAADNQKAFDQQFGQATEPKQAIVMVRIVGVSPDVSYGATASAIGILTSLFSSTMGGRWFSPNQAVISSPTATAIQGSNVNTAPRAGSVYFAEFSSLKAMNDFMQQQSCTASDVVLLPNGQSVPTSDPNAYTKACAERNQVFLPSPYGNSIGAIDQFRSGIWKVTRVAILVILVIATMIMAGNVGKIIADSRRETAVFRALGAKGTDIDQIYLTYTLLVSLLAALVAIVMGFVVAYYVSNKYSGELSIAAVLAYGAQDVHKQFMLFGFNAVYLAVIVGLVLLAGVFGATIPLIANNRRNPIRDMRDDT